MEKERRRRRKKQRAGTIKVVIPEASVKQIT
jgi:hypothetical protein